MEKKKTELIKYKGKLYLLKEYTRDDILVAIDSGKIGDKVHFVFLDYDQNYPLEDDEALRLMWVYGWRRALMIETSPKRWALVSFTPTPKEDVFRIYWSSELVDRHHAGCFLKFRRSGFRITEKAASKGYPKIRKVLRQIGDPPDGELQFYDFDSERHFRYLLEEGVS